MAKNNTNNAGRGSQYDWFKKGNNEKANGTSKNPWKVAFKFFKIITIVSLLIFTLVGCVQSMVFKNDSEVGRSVEMYANSDEVAPHVTTFHVAETKAGVESIYKVKRADKNFWLNKRTNKGILDQARKDFKLQNAKKNLKFQDAYKGRVEMFRVTDDKANGVTDGFVEVTKGHPFVFSTASTIWNGGTAPSDINLATAGFNGAKINIENGGTKITSIGTQGIDWGTAPTGTTLAHWKAINDYNLDLLRATLNTKAVTNALTVTSPLPGKGKHMNQETVNDNFALIAQYFHLSIFGNTFEIQNHLLAGVGSSSPWRPLATWGSAWEIGPFYGIFVYPVGWVTANMIEAMPFMDGWESLITIFIVVFVIKIFSFGITFKSIMQQTKMQEMSAKKAIIDAKYADYKGNKQMQSRKQQETQALYKKEGVSPFGSMGSMFIVMPFFFAILRVTYGLPHLKSTTWLGIRFGSTSWKELMTWHEWQYLPLMITAMAFAAAQQILPRLLTKHRDKNRINVHQKAAMKKNNKMQNIMIVVSIVMSVIFTSGMQVYYIASGSWMIIQAFLTHHILVVQSKKKKLKKVKV